MVDPPNCVFDPPNSRLSCHADPPTSQRYFECCNVNDVIESDKCYIFLVGICGKAVEKCRRHFKPNELGMW